MEPTAQLAAATTPSLAALPLTYEAFKPYGSVIQGWDSYMSAPKGIPVMSANQSTAAKFHRLGPLPGTPFSLTQIRNAAQIDVREGATIALTKLKRVKGINMVIPQAVGATHGETPLKSGGAYVVGVALSDKDGNPDLSTLRAFLVTAAQGLICNNDTWRTHLITVNNTMDYACYEQEKCKDAFGHFADIVVPAYNPKPIAAPPPSQVPSASTRLAEVLGDTIQHPAPITSAAFAPFGEIIRASNDAMKVPNVMAVSNKYPADANAVTAVGVYRAVKKAGLERGKVFDIQYMERHAYTTQAFIPMGKATWTGHGEDALGRGGSFLVVVAENGKDDRPDPATLKTFTMEAGTGLSYKAGTWHHPVLILDDTLDLACIEAQVSTGTGTDEPDARDCELLVYDDEPFGRIAVPEL
jgi:allantoicase